MGRSAKASLSARTNHKEQRDKLTHRHEEREARLETIGVMLAQVASKASIDSGE